PVFEKNNSRDDGDRMSAERVERTRSQLTGLQTNDARHELPSRSRLKLLRSFSWRKRVASDPLREVSLCVRRPVKLMLMDCAPTRSRMSGNSNSANISEAFVRP